MSAVKIKGIGKQGLVFIVDLSAPLSQIKSSLLELLEGTYEFFQKNPVSLKFIETDENDEDLFKKKEVQKLIVNNNFFINCDVTVVENTVIKEIHKSRILRKSLRAGNRFIFDGNIILFGDVNPGAKIEITGSFICLGTINGIVYAGQKNPDSNEYDTSEEVCVYGSEINSPQIKIRDQIFENVVCDNKLFISE